MNKLGRICHYGVVVEIVDETLGKLAQRERIATKTLMLQFLFFLILSVFTLIPSCRIVIFFLAIAGIVCSVLVCFSVDYFSFVSLRNDTFYDPAKQQPHPFEYATEANVGIFRYEILEVYEYPWPPKEQERELFDALHDRELQRLAATEEDNRSWNGMRMLQNDTVDSVDLGDNSTSVNGTDVNATDVNTTDVNATDVDATDDDVVIDENQVDENFTKPPKVDLTAAPTAAGGADEDVPDVGPGSTAGSAIPTAAPSAPPSMVNPNDVIADLVDIGVAKPYPDGIGQFDQMFTNAQRGAMLAPIFAFLGLIFSCIEFCCCVYKCSWLPTAIFLYAAFMFQLMTMFLFMSEDFW